MTRLSALPPFVAAPPAMLNLIAETERVSASNTIALVTGETGVGKEWISCAIHAFSPRRAHTFIAFNCGGATRELFESRLFGHHRGSFTGATSDFKGVIREAEGGSLLLDEIGELSLEVQPKLLRFLQEGEILPIGASRPIKTDVRVIAATNRDLEADVRAGRFRADLFERLNMLRLSVPPLRERREDILPLVEHFLERYQQEQGKHGLWLSDEASASLLGYDWPRNVRQLANEIYRLVALSGNDEVIVADHLSPAIRAGANAESTQPVEIVAGKAVIDLSLPLRDAINDMERLFIINALEKTGGNLSQAAAMIKMNRDGLRKAINRLGIEKFRRPQSNE